MQQRDKMLARYIAWEDRLTYQVNQWQRAWVLRWLFAWVSRFGNGIGWYLLIAVVFITTGAALWLPIVAMLGSALFGVLIYRLIKRRTARVRPLHRNHHLLVSILPLDRYSFPSGHTLHAVNFAIQLSVLLPVYALPLALLALMIALSRLVLGLHYFSDVLVGALIGAALALLSLQIQALWW